MKKYLIPVLMAVLLAASCSKLDIAPRGEMNDKEKAYKNPSIREQVLAGVYAYLYNEATWGAFISIRMEAATDVAISRSTTAGEVANNSHTATTLNDPWRVLYAGINAANEFIRLADTYIPDDETAEETAVRLQQICEARFLRAFYYFTLVRMFGDVPFRTEPTTDLNDLDIARTSAVEIYHFIVQELNEIQALMPNPDQVEYGHVANTAAQTALADVYLNLTGYLMKDRLPADSMQNNLMYRRAAHWSRKVLENPVHDITKTDYITVFMNSVRQIPNLNEQIWELQTMYLRGTNGYNTDSRLGKYNGIGGANTKEYAADAWIYQSAGLRPLYAKISEKDVSSYDPESIADTWKDGKDQRATWNCTVFKMTKETKHNAPDTTAVTTSPVNVFQFYPGKYRTIYANTAAECASRSYSGARLPMYRIAEVHLMLAEALNALDDQQGAVEQINIVRRRAKATEVQGVPSQEKVFELVVDERARELCFEGKRRFDLVRWGLYEKKLAEIEPLYRQAYNGELAATSQGWVRDKMGAFNNFNPEVHYIMPIPQDEISRNGLIPQSEQNEGWGGNRKWK
ncbi:RagB/SusD family nutrient uptake outer membrane protein [Alistipes sp.]|uniref:RagB/SusD family nutrient uptake outer membrane protein n=1 Tax=Alistipes sp. TaxID=1872444 RepID=UPI003AF10E67